MSSFNRPPSREQLRKAAELGVTIPPGVTGVGLSRLISAAPPPERHLELARTLGIAIVDGMTYGDLAPRIHAEMGEQGCRALRDNPALKEGKHVIYDGEAHLITRITWSETRPSVSLRLAGGGKAKPVSAFTLRDAYEVDRNGNRLPPA